MVMLAFAQNASNHPTYQNAKFYVEVMDSAYNLLDLGCYPDINGVPMNTEPYYWPYSRFLYVPINTSNSTCNIPYCLATPVGYDYYGTNDENKAFQVSERPYAQFNGRSPNLIPMLIPSGSSIRRLPLIWVSMPKNTPRLFSE